jgi:hypothetical protein
MTDTQIREALLLGAPIFIVVSFAISLCLCLILLPRIHQRIYVGVISSIIIPQLVCIFPTYFYMFFLADKYHSLFGKIAGSLILVSFWISPHWLALLVLSIVVFLRHFRVAERSYLVEALTALAIAGAGTVYASEMTDALLSDAFG